MILKLLKKLIISILIKTIFTFKNSHYKKINKIIKKIIKIKNFNY